MKNKSAFTVALKSVSDMKNAGIKEQLIYGTPNHLNA